MGDWPINGILVISQFKEIKLDDSWCIGNLTQRVTTFMFRKIANYASIIEKFAIEIGPKIH